MIEAENKPNYQFYFRIKCSKKQSPLEIKLMIQEKSNRESYLIAWSDQVKEPSKQECLAYSFVSFFSGFLDRLVVVVVIVVVEGGWVCSQSINITTFIKKGGGIPPITTYTIPTPKNEYP